MVHFVSVFWIIIVQYSGLSSTCGGAGGYRSYNAYEEPPGTTTTEEPPPIGGMQKNARGAYGGFRVPEAVEAAWKRWEMEFKMLEAMKNSQLTTEEREKIDLQRGPFNHWPLNWNGLGAGHAGFPPEEVPPWGERHQYSGAPLYCYLGPESVPCDPVRKPVHRYGFNAYEGNCVLFLYSGCGGNENNFEQKHVCQNTCMPLMPPSGCEFDSDILITTEERERRRNLRKCGEKEKK